MFLVAKMFNQVVYVFVVKVPLNEPKVSGDFLVHFVLKEDFQKLKVLYDGVYFLAIECEGFF